MQIDNICPVNGLILAAGLSSRMGAFKPLLPFGSKTLIEASIDSMLSAHVRQVIVVLGFRGPELEAVLKKRYGSEVICAWNLQYGSTDMLESVKCGLRAMPECQSFFLLPGDMPVVSRSTFSHLLNARPKQGSFLLFPTLEGHPKHPPLIHKSLIPHILEYQGEGGLRRIWTQYEAISRYVPVDDPGVWIDLDTRSEYESCVSRFAPV
ncbi:nucleotidyltransferase family protein [Lacrimispora sp. 210928-DFI.3.58]|uniref:nucleotidyltransferase family protein n=1 Tax=Lacrimispora sp. 210928-DFI.3.58 TaxID=2883214 RepID=UPI001D08D9CF|nr:nucleotidyltransferase family protein [Lacrimispora sp. 210928-DFI.3.58]MCB7320606.1 nucleotidyltransferase family protein [Lacrimispora sp. 210928-DFI.3.58]